MLGHLADFIGKLLGFRNLIAGYNDVNNQLRLAEPGLLNLGNTPVAAVRRSGSVGRINRQEDADENQNGTYHLYSG